MRLERLQGATWKRGKLFVDLFSGVRSPVGRQVAQRGGAYIAFDVLIDERFDLGNPEVMQVLVSWMRNGWIWVFGWGQTAPLGHWQVIAKAQVGSTPTAVGKICGERWQS